MPVEDLGTWPTTAETEKEKEQWKEEGENTGEKELRRFTIKQTI